MHARRIFRYFINFLTSSFLSVVPYAADSDRNIFWNRGPVNCTPTSLSPGPLAAATCTTLPRVEKSNSSRFQGWYDCGMRISRSEPMATSNRVTNAAPLRERFSLEVSSVKITPRESRPVTCIGKRTASLRSVRCFERYVLVAIFGRLLLGENRVRNNLHSHLAFKKPFHCIKHFAGCPCFVNRSSELAAVSHAMRKPACELLHFSHSIGLRR